MFKFCQKVALFRVNTQSLAYFVAYLILIGFVVLFLSAAYLMLLWLLLVPAGAA